MGFHEEWMKLQKVIEMSGNDKVLLVCLLQMAEQFSYYIDDNKWDLCKEFSLRGLELSHKNGEKKYEAKFCFLLA